MPRIPLGFAIALLATSAGAQVAERPDLRAGDRWRFVDYYTVASREPNRERRITEVTGERILGVENGEPLAMSRDLNVLESWRERSSNPQLLRFPLAVGARWSYANEYLFKPKGSSGRADVEVEVLGYEPVSVVAGTYDAFKLRARSRLSGHSPIGSIIDAVSVTTYWYAPAARSVVRWEVQHPYLGPSTTELVDLELAR